LLARAPLNALLLLALAPPALFVQLALVLHLLAQLLLVGLGLTIASLPAHHWRLLHK
jgi:hypothetical protein